MFDFQLIQVAPRALQLNVGGDEESTARAKNALLAFLRAQGLSWVQVQASCGADRVRGKLKR
ncbi:MAG TPA: hypothetical protein VFP68_18715 [Burkholderiaceae bacterium]|nr:hypothetical protein [Burkholderiaceae bacterium]